MAGAMMHFLICANVASALTLAGTVDFLDGQRVSEGHLAGQVNKTYAAAFDEATAKHREATPNRLAEKPDEPTMLMQGAKPKHWRIKRAVLPRTHRALPLFSRFGAGIGGSVDALAPAALVHIPKCAGTSLKSDIKAILPRFDDSYSEFCFAEAHRRFPRAKTWIAMFRSPRAHVVSQHLECKYDKWGKSKTSHTRFPRSGTMVSDFERWIEHFSAGESTNDYNCYNPWNMQTRALSCHGRGGNQPFFGEGIDAHHSYGHSPDLASAERHLGEFAHIGLVEFYHESLCLLRYRVSSTLDASCECGGPAQMHKHVTHGVPAHDDIELTDHAVDLIDEMTAMDMKLYAKAVDRFLSEIKSVESESGKKIICDAKMKAFKKKVAYVDGIDLPEDGPIMLAHGAHVTRSGLNATTIINGILDVPIVGLP
jgi:hypothetical protein